MNRKFFIIISFTTFCLGLLSGCYKDNGNYSYHPINEVTITADVNAFTLLQFDTLKIAPHLSQTMDKGSLSYSWAIYNADVSVNYPDHPPVVISTERNLDLRMVQEPRSYPYDLIYTVTDTLTGVSFKHDFKVQINSALSEGWMLLTSNGTKGDIDFILPGDKLLKGVFSSANPDLTLPGDVTQVSQLYGYNSNLTFVFWQDGGYILDKNTFTVDGDLADIFYGKPDVIRPEMIYIDANSTTAYLVNNGKLHNEPLIAMASKFGAAFPGKNTIAPYVMTGTRQDVFFDLQNHKFVYIPTNGTSFSNFPVKSVDDAYDLNNVPGTLLTIQPTSGLQFVALFKNAGEDSTSVYLVAPRDSKVASGYKKASPSIDLNDATHFAGSPILAQLYYSIGNAIYLYDIAADQARKIYSFPASEKIEVLKMNGNNGLVASTYNGTSSSFYFFNLASTGNIENNAPNKTFTGFEHIIDVNYKNR